MARARHHFLALARGQRPVALRIQRDVHRLGPGIPVVDAGVGRHDGRRELAARGHDRAHVLAPEAAVAAAHDDFGHRLLAAQRLVARLQVEGGAQAERIGGGLRHQLRQPEDPGQLHVKLLAPLRRPAMLPSLLSTKSSRRDGMALWGGRRLYGAFARAQGPWLDWSGAGCPSSEGGEKVGAR